MFWPKEAGPNKWVQLLGPESGFVKHLAKIASIVGIWSLWLDFEHVQHIIALENGVFREISRIQL